LPRPQHYPLRAHRIYALNTPSWLGAFCSGALKPIMRDVEHKLRFFSPSEVQAGALTEFIDAQNLPVAYGGKSKVALGESKYEKAMRAFVDKANRRAGVKVVTPVS